MRISGIDVYEYTVPLIVPVPYAGWYRSGLLLRLQSSSAAGWGEVAPLLGYSPEDLDTAKEENPRCMQAPSGAYRYRYGGHNRGMCSFGTVWCRFGMEESLCQ